MGKRTFFVCLSSLLFCLSFMGGAYAANAPIAEVLTVVPGASLTRGGQTLPLEKFSPLHLSDTVSTNATGRARILFNDDSTVDMGGNSSLDMRDFADSGAKSVFNVHLLQGVARVVTGRIVEQNPKGFAVSTPEGTVGIRGTIVSLRSGNGTTTVYVENTTREVYVNNIHVPGGQKITIPGDPMRPEPIMPQDRRNLGRDLAFRGGTGVAAAAPEPTRDRTRPEEQLPAASRLAATADLVPPDTPLADIALPTQSLGDSLMAGGGGGGGGLMASVTGGSGALISASSLGFTAAFGFNVDLSSGVISGAWMNGSGTASSFVYGTQTLMVNVSGGAGLADSSGFTINTGFSGTKTWGGSPITPAVELFNTGVTLSDFNLMPTTSSVFVDYSIYDGGGVYDYGAGVGTLIK